MANYERRQQGVLVDGVVLYEQVGGKCFSYAIAHVLKMHPSKVPDFAYGDDSNFAANAHDWLALRGKGMVFVPNREFYEIENGDGVAYNRKGFPSGEAIACVQTIEGGEDEYHAVYIRDGVLMLHPNSSDLTITKIIGYFVVYDLNVSM